MTYQLAFTMRCGSTLLCEYLAVNGLGQPTEYFQYDGFGVMAPRYHKALGVADDDLEGYLRALRAARAPNGIFGGKISWHQKNALLDDARRRGLAARDLDDLFPEFTWLYMRRRDQIAQAVSAWRAMKSGRWHSPDPVTAADRPEYDYYRILSVYQSILTEERLWDAYFRRRPAPPLPIDYDDLVARPRAVLLEVATRVQGPAKRLASEDDVTLTARVERMRDDYSAEVHARFTEDLERIGAAGHWAARRDQVRRWQEFFDKEMWKGAPRTAPE